MSLIILGLKLLVDRCGILVSQITDEVQMESLGLLIGIPLAVGMFSVLRNYRIELTSDSKEEVRSR